MRFALSNVVIYLVCHCYLSGQYIDYTPPGDWISFEITDNIDETKIIFSGLNADSVSSQFILYDGELIDLSSQDNYESVEYLNTYDDNLYFFAIDTLELSHILHLKDGVITDISPTGNFRLSGYQTRRMSNGGILVSVEPFGGVYDELLLVTPNGSTVITPAMNYSYLSFSNGEITDRVYMLARNSSGDNFIAFYDFEYGFLDKGLEGSSHSILDANPSDKNHVLITNPTNSSIGDAQIYRVVDSTFTKVVIPLEPYDQIYSVIRIPLENKTIFSATDTSGIEKILMREAGNNWTDLSLQLPIDIQYVIRNQSLDKNHVLTVSSTPNQKEVYVFNNDTFFNVTPIGGPFDRVSYHSSSSPSIALFTFEKDDEVFLYSLNLALPIFGLNAMNFLNPEGLPVNRIYNRANGFYLIKKYWKGDSLIENESLYRFAPLSGLTSISDKPEVERLTICQTEKHVIINEDLSISEDMYYVYDYNAVKAIDFPSYDTLDYSYLTNFSSTNVCLIETVAFDDDHDLDRRRRYGYIDNKLIDITHPYYNPYSNSSYSTFNDHKEDQVVGIHFTTDTSGSSSYKLYSILDEPQSLPCNAHDKMYYNSAVFTEPLINNQAIGNNYLGFQSEAADGPYYFSAQNSTELLPAFELEAGVEITILQEDCN